MRARRRAAAIGLAVAGLAAVAVPVIRQLAPDAAPAADLEAQLHERTEGALRIERTSDGAVRFLGTEPGGGIRAADDDPAGALVDTYAPLLGAGGATVDLTPTRTTPSLGGGSATRFQQTMGGIPVLGGEVSVQVGADGTVRSALADVSRADPPDLTATVPADVAEDTALAGTARAVGVARDRLEATVPQRWVYDPAVIGPATALAPSLVWRMEVTGPAVRQLVLVDARRGGVALSFSRLAHARDRRVCDGANVRAAEACTGGYARTEGQSATGISEVDDAYDFSGATYDYFADRFGRDGIADDGAPVVSMVRHCPVDTAKACPYDNAFWNGSQLTFGDGFAAADDVVAHELTHGVTEHTANLFYWYQSGAINESMSDVFGELVDLADGLGTDTPAVRWELGEDLPGIGALRDMQDPAAFGDPDRTGSPLYRGATSDGGGVHTNSGVGNRAASLLADGGTVGGHPAVTGIGLAKTGAVFYEALTTLLVSGSDYADLGVALPQACTNLVADGAADLTAEDCAQVEAAVVATEMATSPTNAPATEAPVCAAGLEAQPFFADDLENRASGNWAFDTAQGQYRWAYEATPILEYATSGIQSFWGADVGQTSDRRIRMTSSVPLPAGTTPYLRFRHAYGFETSGGTNWDGGVVEWSTDGGSTWQDLGPRFDANGYPGTLVAGGTNPLAGRQAFVDVSRGYLSSRADLSPWAGQSIRFRFRIGEDVEVGTPYGWFVDDIEIYTCAPIPQPDLELDFLTDQTSVLAGEGLDLHVTVHNTGDVALTGVGVDAEVADDCDEVVGDLAVGAEVTIDCTYTTLDPDDVGSWSDAATATADQLDGPVDATTAPVTVLANEPAATVTQVADQERVVAGESIDLHVTVHNTGNVALTGVALTNDTATACDGPLADLAPDAEVTVDCTTVTVPPDDVGTWTNTASLAADQLATPVVAEPTSVQVDARAPSLAVTFRADQDEVAAGGDIDLHLQLENTGNVALTGIVVTEPDCGGPVADLAPDEQVTVDCTHATAPEDQGPYTTTATVDADQIDPMATEEVSVLVRRAALEAIVTSAATTVTAGNPVALSVEVHNPGNVDLTGVGVTAPTCPGTTSLAAGATTTLTCAAPSSAGDVAAFALTGALAPEVTVDSEQTDPVTATLDPAVEVTIPPHGFGDGVAWADEAISWQSFHGIAEGFADGTFRPNAEITRGQVVRMLWRLAGEPAPAQGTGCGAGPLVDVPNWVRPAVDWATCDPDADGPEPALMAGFGDRTFRPGDPITRAQVVRTVWRFAGEPGPSGTGCGPAPFTDVPPWVRPAVDWATCDPDADGPEPALMAGFGDQTFRSGDPITRAQTARLLLRTALLLAL